MFRAVYLVALMVLLTWSGTAQQLFGGLSVQSSILPHCSLHEAGMELGLSTGGWTLSATSTFAEGALARAYLETAGYIMGYRLKVRGKLALSGQPKLVKRLYRSLDEQAYDQLRWELFGPHFRYGWLKGEYPLPGGELTAKAYLRADSSAEVEQLYFLDAYRWLPGESAWAAGTPLVAAAKHRAFVAGKVRLQALVDGEWRSRTEYNLRAHFVPTASPSVRLAAPATEYLNAKYPHGWQLREPIAVEEVKVYLWLPAYSELELQWEGELGAGPGKLEVEATFADRGAGRELSQVEVSWSGQGPLLARPAAVTATWTPQGGLDEIAAEVEGLTLWKRLTADLAIHANPTGGELSIVPTWSGWPADVALHGEVEWQDGALRGLRLYGMSAAWRLGTSHRLEAVWALCRPPYPRPAWYRTADFEELAETGEFEDARLAISKEGRDHSWLAAAYFGPGAARPLGCTRICTELTVRIGRSSELELAFQTDHPGTEGHDPSLRLGWGLQF
ncbi:MAG: hypothetical protein ACP5G2_02780 [Candidatus Bipolaricaulaceae bacterium]